jgi:HEAT repeat protein
MESRHKGVLHRGSLARVTALKMAAVILVVAAASSCARGRKEVRSVPAAPDLPISVKSWQILTTGLEDTNEARRMEVVAALGTIGTFSEVVRRVEDRLSDPDSKVRQIAIDTLARMKSRRSIPRLREALNDSDPEVCFAAAHALWELGDRSGRDVLLKVLAGDMETAEGPVKAKLREVKDTLEDPEAIARIALKRGARALLGPFAIALGIASELNKDNGAPSRALSASLLERDHTAASHEELQAALGDDHWTVRAAAARSLGHIQREDVIDSLEPLLDDKVEAVRYTAAASIVRITWSSSARKSKSEESEQIAQKTAGTGKHPNGNGKKTAAELRKPASLPVGEDRPSQLNSQPR